jgi:hypothetical protein
MPQVPCQCSVVWSNNFNRGIRSPDLTTEQLRAAERLREVFRSEAPQPFSALHAIEVASDSPFVWTLLQSSLLRAAGFRRVHAKVEELEREVVKQDQLLAWFATHTPVGRRVTREVVKCCTAAATVDARISPVHVLNPVLSALYVAGGWPALVAQILTCPRKYVAAKLHHSTEV